MTDKSVGAEREISRLQVVTVYVSDIDRARDFYAAQLGLDVVAEWTGDHGDRAIFTLPAEGQTELMLYAPPAGDQRIGRGTGMVFTSPDVRATYALLRERGVRFTRELTMLPYGEGDLPGDTGDLEAEFCDPDGNQFLLHS